MIAPTRLRSSSSATRHRSAYARGGGWGTSSVAAGCEPAGERARRSQDAVALSSAVTCSRHMPSLSRTVNTTPSRRVARDAGAADIDRRGRAASADRERMDLRIHVDEPADRIAQPRADVVAVQRGARTDLLRAERRNRKPAAATREPTPSAASISRRFQRHRASMPRTGSPGSPVVRWASPASTTMGRST